MRNADRFIHILQWPWTKASLSSAGSSFPHDWRTETFFNNSHVPLSARHRELRSIHREIYAQPTYHPPTSSRWRFLHRLGARLFPGRLPSLGAGAITTHFSWSPENSIAIKSSSVTASVRLSGCPERLNAKMLCTKTGVNVALVLPKSASCQHHILRWHLPRSLENLDLSRTARFFQIHEPLTNTAALAADKDPLHAEYRQSSSWSKASGHCHHIPNISARMCGKD